MNSHSRRTFALIFIALLIMLAQSCSRPQNTAKAKEAPSRPSDIKVEVKPGGPLVLTTNAASFEVSPGGYIQAFLLNNGQRLTLDDPESGKPNESDYLVQKDGDTHFILDFDQANVLEAMGKLGRGKRITIPAHLLGHQDVSLQRVLTVEAYDDFPNMLISTV